MKWMAFVSILETIILILGQFMDFNNNYGSFGFILALLHMVPVKHFIRYVCSGTNQKSLGHLVWAQHTKSNTTLLITMSVFVRPKKTFGPYIFFAYLMLEIWQVMCI